MNITKIFGFLLVGFSLTFFVACNKNSDSGNRDARGGNGVTGVATTGNGSLPSGYYQQADVVLSSTEQAAKDFLLPNVGGDATRIGSISSGNVKMSAYVVIQRQNNQSNGPIDAAYSYIQITVNDSLTGTQDSSGRTLPPFQVKIYGKSGTVNGSSVDITFGDAYGTVHVVGALNGSSTNSQFTGKVDFVNNSPYQANGTLGQFTIPTCSFFDCGK